GKTMTSISKASTGCCVRSNRRPRDARRKTMPPDCSIVYLLLSTHGFAIDSLSSYLRRIRAKEPIPLIGPLPFKADALLYHLVGELAGTLAQVDRYPFSHPRDHIEQIRFLTRLPISPQPSRHT